MNAVCDRLLVGVCGSIGLFDHLFWLAGLGLAREVRVIVTPAATAIVKPQVVRRLVDCTLWTDPWEEIEGVRVPHADLPRWADVFVVMPATANTIASAAHGRADNLLTLAILSSTSPVGFVPCMSADMWQAPATRRNVGTLRGDGHEVLDPGAGAGFAVSVSGAEQPAASSLDAASVRRFVARLATGLRPAPAEAAGV